MSSTSQNDLQRRLVALEELYLHAERQLHELNEALVSQQRQISTLETRLTQWMSQTQENERTLGGDRVADVQAPYDNGSSALSPDQLS